MSAYVITFAVAVLTAGILGLGLLRTSAREMPVDVLAEPYQFIDWDHDLAWLLWEEGVHVETVHLPASDEELLDLADVVGVLV